MTVPSQRIVALITTAADKKFGSVAHMADVIIDLTLQQGGCLPQDLLSQGFEHQDITALWHFANTLAAIELNHMKESVFLFSQKELQHA